MVKREGSREATALSDQAIDWLVRLHSGRATDDDRDAFDAWRTQSEAHELAAREAEALWDGVGVAGEKTRKTARKKKVTRRAMLGGIAVATGGVALARSGLIGPYLFADHVTAIGEQKTITLPDGSSVFLNASTALSVDYDQGTRILSLFHGEAVFTVAHDAGRPFVVQAGDGRTQAIGTVFNVDIGSSEVSVTVLEGKVEVTGESGPASVQALSGQRVRYGGADRPSPPEQVDVDAETAWRRGKLIFNRKPLGDVVVELGRYRRGRIIVARDSLRALEVTGVFDLAEPEEVLRMIEDTLPVQVIRLPLVTVLR